MGAQWLMEMMTAVMNTHTNQSWLEGHLILPVLRYWVMMKMKLLELLNVTFSRYVSHKGMSFCLYVCLCISLHVYCVFICVCIHYISYMCLYMCICMCVFCICTHIHVYNNNNVYVYAYIYVCVYMCMCVYTCVCVH